ncbi:hypothetical protein [Anaerosporobacter sp.]
MKRSWFWCAIIVISIIEIILIGDGRDLYFEELLSPRIIALLVTLIVFYCVLVLRLKNAGKSGWIAFLCVVVPWAIRQLDLPVALLSFTRFIPPLSTVVIGLLPSVEKHAVYRDDNSSKNVQSKYNDLQ